MMLKPFVSGIAVGVVALYAFTGAYAKSRNQQFDELAQPDHWVPFVAKRVFHTAHGDEIATAYRNSAGSTATYLEPEGLGLVTIHNAETKLTYARVAPDKWISFPMKVPIPPVPQTTAKFKLHTVARLNETVASLPVYEIADGNQHHRIVPGLNGL